MLRCTKTIMESRSEQPCAFETATVYAVVMIGATNCVRHVGQFGFINPVQVMLAKESKGTLTNASIILVSPGMMTWSSPRSTLMSTDTLIMMISFASQSLASRAVIV